MRGLGCQVGPITTESLQAEEKGTGRRHDGPEEMEREPHFKEGEERPRAGKGEESTDSALGPAEGVQP